MTSFYRFKPVFLFPDIPLIAALTSVSTPKKLRSPFFLLFLHVRVIVKRFFEMLSANFFHIFKVQKSASKKTFRYERLMISAWTNKTVLFVRDCRTATGTTSCETFLTEITRKQFTYCYLLVVLVTVLVPSRETFVIQFTRKQLTYWYLVLALKKRLVYICL